MDFKMEAVLPNSPGDVWLVMVDIGIIAACIPGCEQIEEQEKLKLAEERDFLDAARNELAIERETFNRPRTSVIQEPSG